MPVSVSAGASIETGVAHTGIWNKTEGHFRLFCRWSYIRAQASVCVFHYWSISSINIRIKMDFLHQKDLWDKNNSLRMHKLQLCVYASELYAFTEADKYVQRWWLWHTTEHIFSLKDMLKLRASQQMAAEDKLQRVTWGQTPQVCLLWWNSDTSELLPDFHSFCLLLVTLFTNNILFKWCVAGSLSFKKTDLLIWNTIKCILSTEFQFDFNLELYTEVHHRTLQ